MTDRVSNIISWFKNNRATSILIFLCIVLIASSTFISSVKNLRENLFGHNGLFQSKKDSSIVIGNDIYKNDSSSIDEIFKNGPLYFKLFFENIELNKKERPNWNYSFLNGRMLFQAFKNDSIGRYIKGGIFKDGVADFKLIKNNGFNDYRVENHAYFGWIEKTQMWQSIANDSEAYFISNNAPSFSPQPAYIEGFMKNDFIIENNTMQFVIIEQNDDWAKIEIKKKFIDK
jgi:hypothetical protein